MSQKSPFSHLFQLFGSTTEKHVDSINRDALKKMMTLLQLPVDAAGRCILLRAPRAGYGKSHLLTRAQSQLGSSHEFILLQPANGYRVDANAVLNDVISKLTRALPGGAGLTVLDLLARKIFALGLEPLVRSGEVPCQDRETALTALQNRPIETFDFHHHTAVTAHWARDHFEILGPRLVVEIAQIITAPLREVGFWVDALFRYAVTPINQPGRSGMLMGAVLDASAAAPMNERLTTLLKMMTQWQRVILVADELEGMSANAEAALRFAAFVTNLRHGAERVEMIISVNDDVWESAFAPRLSGGLQDRLSEAVVQLEPLSPEQAFELLQSRDPHAKREQTLDFRSQGPLYSRLVLRNAAQSWQPNEQPIVAMETPESLSETKEENMSHSSVISLIDEEDALGLTEADYGIPFFSADKFFSEPLSPFVDDIIAGHFELANKSVVEPIVNFVPTKSHEAKAFEPNTAIKPFAFPHGVVADPSQVAASCASYGAPESKLPSPISLPAGTTYGATVLPLETSATNFYEQAQSAGINRVDELLRQFRERYGRSDS